MSKPIPVLKGGDGFYLFAMKAVVDRIEEGLVVLEIAGQTEVIWPLKLLPPGLKPGNILDINITLDKKTEAQQREKIKKLQQKLKNR